MYTRQCLYVCYVAVRYSVDLRDEHLCGLARAAGSSLCRADLGWCSRLSDAALQELARSCPRLRELRLGWAGQRISDLGMLAVATHCADIT